MVYRQRIIRRRPVTRRRPVRPVRTLVYRRGPLRVRRSRVNRTRYRR